MGELFEISADLYKFWHLDLQKNTIKIVCQDGRILEDELQPEFSHDNPQVASSTFDWEKWWIVSTTTLGDVIITEGFNPNSPPPLHNRPSVYLDQNHWRTVTDVLQNPNKDKGVEEFEAARELVRLATDGGLVLPLSMGHMLETTGLHSERRYQVGVSMASLSGGWQIRNPLDIWKWEAERTIREHFGIPTEEPF